MTVNQEWKWLEVAKTLPAAGLQATSDYVRRKKTMRRWRMFE